MRIGLWGFAFAMFCLFLIMINSFDDSAERIDTLFEGIDANLSDANFSGDANLTKFARYTAQGIVKEFHGTYYLAAFINPHLPLWFIGNSELLAAIAIVALFGLIFGKIVLLIVLALFMWVWEQVKKRRRFKDGKEKG